MYTQSIGLALGGVLGAGAALTTDSSAVGVSVATVVAGTSCLLADRITRAVAAHIGNSIKTSLQKKETAEDFKGRLIQLAIQQLINQDLNKIAYKVLKNLDAGIKPNPLSQEIGLKIADQVMKTEFKGLLASPFRGIIHSTIARVMALALVELSFKEAVTKITPNIFRMVASRL